MILGADAGAHLTCWGLWPGVRWRPLEKELNLPNPLGSAWPTAGRPLGVHMTPSHHRAHIPFLCLVTG